MKKQLIFRFMEEKDIDQILRIEKECFPTPWSRESFENELLLNKYALYVVLEEEEQVIGYCGSWLIIDEAHITNIAILPEHRGRKLGDALLRKVMDIARAEGIKRMTLEVRVSNQVALALYRKLGFQEGGIRRNYYSDNEDALVMWVNL